MDMCNEYNKDYIYVGCYQNPMLAVCMNLIALHIILYKQVVARIYQIIVTMYTYTTQ